MGMFWDFDFKCPECGQENSVQAHAPPWGPDDFGEGVFWFTERDIPWNLVENLPPMLCSRCATAFDFDPTGEVGARPILIDSEEAAQHEWEPRWEREAWRQARRVIEREWRETPRCPILAAVRYVTDALGDEPLVYVTDESGRAVGFFPDTGLKTLVEFLARPIWAERQGEERPPFLYDRVRELVVNRSGCVEYKGRTLALFVNGRSSRFTPKDPHHRRPKWRPPRWDGEAENDVLRPTMNIAVSSDGRVSPSTIVPADVGEPEGGRWLAFPIPFEELPEQAFFRPYDNRSWWRDKEGKEAPRTAYIGRGDTPQAALDDMLRRIELSRPEE